MAIKRYKPTSAARRFMTVHAYDEITEVKPERGLVEDMRKSGGRNNQGKITVRHIGGGNRRKYRIIDFKRNKDGIPAKVKSIQYDPNRSANIALLVYADGEKRYILAPVGLNVGDTVMRTSRRATASPLKTSPSARWCTTSSSNRARAGRSPGLRASPHSSWRRKASTPR